MNFIEIEKPTPGTHYCFQIEPNKHVLAILGRPCFACAQIAELHRLNGIAIPKKAEMEQAYTILYLLNLYLQHGEKWSEVGDQELAALHEKYIKNG